MYGYRNQQDSYKTSNKPTKELNHYLLLSFRLFNDKSFSNLM
jgi:hypothetical protein